jgi:hypothetical protein
LLLWQQVASARRDVSGGNNGGGMGGDGISLHTANGIVADASSADGFLVVRVQLLMSAYAPRKTAERTSDALLHRPADGQLVCRWDRISYGQRLVGKRQLEDAPEEQAHIAMIREILDETVAPESVDDNRTSAVVIAVGPRRDLAGFPQVFLDG